MAMSLAQANIQPGQWIAGCFSSDGQNKFDAFQADTGAVLGPTFLEATPAEVDQALEAADAAFDDFRETAPETRAQLLETIADNILELGDALLERVHQETGLPPARCQGERGRAVNQTKMFAQMIREGSWVRAVLDAPDPDRQPLPKPDVRKMYLPIGPVAVFGASNFPLAISVVGTDTTTALAAGCPVIVKAHPGHPGTCDLLAQAVNNAVEKLGLPPGIFSLVQSAGHEIGKYLVQHPLTQAVAFTGSLAGGRALCDLAAQRPVPIPVYAEMGSINPVFLLPGALEKNYDSIAKGFFQSLTMGVGQFCTCPGLVLGLQSDPLEKFLKHTRDLIHDYSPATMLHAGIAEAYRQGVEKTKQIPGIQIEAQSHAPETEQQASCQLMSISAEIALEQRELLEETFGPSSIVVRAETPEQMVALAQQLEGSLSATLHGTQDDLKEHRPLVRVLERKAGRIIFNGFPTGIEVCNAMHHGGPYPAASHSHFTSIGPSSIERFVRPVCYQGFPSACLPAELQDNNPLGIWRLEDNQWKK